MNKKIIGIVVCTLLIATTVPTYIAVNVKENNTNVMEEDFPEIYTLPMSPGNYFKHMFFDREIRSYRLHIPPSYDGSKPVPLLFVFHGCPSGALAMMLMTELNKKADEEGFIVVYPNGHLDIPYILYWVKELGPMTLILGFRYWNFWDFIDTKVDDIGYFEKLLVELQNTLNVNSSRIYVTGTSGGGFMSYRLGAEFSDIIAAIAPSSGSIARAWKRMRTVTT